MTEIEQLVEVHGKDAAAEELIVTILATRAWRAMEGDDEFPWINTDTWRKKIRKAQGR